MVFLELVDASGDEVVYDYMPERKDAPRGRVSVNKTTRDRKWLKPSEDGEWSAYRGHAWYRIDKMIDKGEYPNTDVSVWY